jgi:hypothetical protein
LRQFPGIAFPSNNGPHNQLSSYRAQIADHIGASHTRFSETLKVLQEEGIPVFSIGFSRSKSSETDRQMRRDLETLKTLNNATGGGVLFSMNQGMVSDESRA